ncbi:hypothetical protein ACM46_18400 [Chryseobacterium angstadtii]|uniref:C1q domain-containing protein n=1 Tax=Chryseobacterium angstadtii TaxID=558151 RepID=A0A0J7I1Q8_9FLAO|nr:hypothetical protein [Chryseobacterium angstadtii]KMQ60197.1 hypothetical protein ACM46_18400 [Chryseobacterium angstadtii]
MRNNRNIFVVLFIFIMIKTAAQMGINTAVPEAMLDINGDLRVRVAEQCEGGSCADSILVKTGGGYVQTISKQQLLNQNIKSYVSGAGTDGTILLSLSILSNWLKVGFDREIIDENNDFDVGNYTFTAPGKGIYDIYVQLKASSLVGVGDFGAGIFVKRGNNPPELIADESYLNISLLNVNVSPPTRKTQNIVALDAGDQVFFGARTSLLSLELLAGSSSFFSIYQIK